MIFALVIELNIIDHVWHNTKFYYLSDFLKILFRFRKCFLNVLFYSVFSFMFKTFFDVLIHSNA